MEIGSNFLNIGYLDSLSYRASPVHRIDPRIKTIVTIVYVVTVVSFPRYEVSGLLPFFIYPVFLISVGNIPPGFVLRKLLLVSPFVVMVGMFNPIFDRTPMLELYGVEISGGWVSFTSILLKFVLTISTALLLIATTSFTGICEGLGRMGVPQVFVVQLLFLYRYLFVLVEEALRMVRARDARSSGKRGKGVRVFIHLVGVLLVRTIQRAERIYAAMLSRGYTGRMPLRRTHRIGMKELIFLSSWILLFLVMRRYNLSLYLGILLGQDGMR